ncbi:MAG: hypothetical protein HQL12_06585 [Candidatus Omnitrophica bacterium]|nr:hypothetical protein [Candidatus Omnitrophota bacterium]
MNDLIFTVSGAGLRDGLNPCIFMTCAFFITHGLWLKRISLRTGWLRFNFVLVYALGILVFNFGPAQIFVLQKNFIFTAKILYFILGVWAFVAGVLFFKDWFFLRRGLPVEDMTGKKMKIFFAGDAVVVLATVIPAMVLSALATLWPVDKYILLLGNLTILKGQWQMVMPLLVSYVVISMWALWLLWVLLGIKNLRLSLLKIICSSVFFTASSCMILMFQ